MNRIPTRSPRRHASGLSLIELMIAVALGVLVVLAAMTIFASNKAAYRSTDSLGVVQETARTAFEMMSRDIREGAGNPCNSRLGIANVVNTSGANWWSNFTDWGQAVRGYDASIAFPDQAFGTGSAERLANTDAIQLISGDTNVATVTAYNPAGSFTVNRADHGVANGDLVMVCNSSSAAVFQASTVSGTTINYGTGGTPGNCSLNLGLLEVGAACNTRPAAVFFGTDRPSALVRLNASRWYIANNPNGRPSLYHTRLTAGAPTTEEVAEGVSAMTITYLIDGSANYVTATTVGANWANVIAARINMTIQGQPGTGVAATPLTRDLVHVVSLRSRTP